MKIGISNPAEVQELMCRDKNTRSYSATNGAHGDHDDERHENGSTRIRPSSKDMMLQSVRLFRKYLVRRSRKQNIIGMSEPQDIRKYWSTSARPPFPSELGRATSRPPSLLERKLLPVWSSGNDASTDHEASAAAAASQMTIFYAGVVNVYEDVPVEKAQAIMLLASTLSKAVGSETPPPPPPPPPPPVTVPKASPPPPTDSSNDNGHSLSFKSKASAALIPMARRIINKCPSSSSTRGLLMKTSSF